MKVLVFILTTILIQSQVNGNDFEYSKCLETKVYCQGLPGNCLQGNSKCDILLIAYPSNTQKVVEFQMFGRPDKNKQWFAMGLSSHRQMGNSSVTEIYVSSDGKSQAMRQSYNIGYMNQVITEGVTGLTQVGNVINSNGVLSAKWTRNAVTKVHSNEFDIINNKYYIMLAAGPIDSHNVKRRHSETSVSLMEVDFQFGINQTLKELYKNCKNSETNLCFGLPSDNCIESQNCNLVLSVTKSGFGLSSGTVSFQMIGKSDEADSGWIAMALSDDQRMGNDSVVECLLLSNSTTLLRNSWNTVGQDNQVIGDVPGVNRSGQVVYQDGWINCKWTRTAQTKVNNIVFDLIKKKYYILLAKGGISDQKSATKRFHSEMRSSKLAASLESLQDTTTVGTTIKATTSSHQTTHNGFK